MKGRLIDAIRGALSRCGIDAAEVRLEHPSDLAHGDYATGIALQYAKHAGMSPRPLAEKIAAALGKVDGVERIEIAGPGFINFHLSPDALAREAERARSDDMWGANTDLAGKKIMIDYTQPNPFKPFHIGHLMSNAIGESLARLSQFAGAQVIRVNYQGDVGPHVAKAIWAMRKNGTDPHDVEAIGKAYAEGNDAYESDPSAKAEIDAINKQIYEHSDAQIDAIYDAGREASLQHFEELYKILGTKFDEYYFESQSWKPGLEIVNKNLNTVFEESQGAIVFPGERYGLNTRVFVTSAGLPTYEGKELGLTQMKFAQFSPDLSIVETASEQKNMFDVTFKALELIEPSYVGKLKHIYHGMMRFAEGKMSSRKGNVITGESLLADVTEEAQSRAKESRAENTELLAQQVAVAAIKYQILKQSSGKDIIFDRDRALSLEGDSGPYLQYAHARTHQIVERGKSEGITAKTDGAENFGDVGRLLVRFPDVVHEAASLMEPHVLTTYLTALASTFNSWYASVQILDGTPAATHKVALTDAVRKTLKNGLWILGIPAPEQM
jgi:arginyl-tRNA synthetase